MKKNRSKLGGKSRQVASALLRTKGRLSGRNFESLENRSMLAADSWHNAANPIDVNGDGTVQPIDALMIINELNSHGSYAVSARSSLASGAPVLSALAQGSASGNGSSSADVSAYLDVNGDGLITPSDALQVLDALAANTKVVIRLQVTDLDGNPIQAIPVNQDFKLEAYVQDVRSQPFGVFAAYLDVSYETALASIDPNLAVDSSGSHNFEYGPVFTGGQYEDTTTAGRIEDSGAFSGFDEEGPGEFLLWRTVVHANAAGTVHFVPDPGEGNGHDVLVYRNEPTGAAVDPADIDFESVNLEITDGTRPLVSIDNVSAAEGGAVSFTASLSTALATPVTFVVNTSPGTASASDFTAVTAQTITFLAGETTKTIDVQTTQDTISEASETFNITLSNISSNASLGQFVGIGTITDNDPFPTVSINSASGIEGSVIGFTVTLSAASGQTSSVVVRSTNTTTSNADLTTVNQTITFLAGETTKAVNVTTTQDALVEANETFKLTLSSPTNLTLAGGGASSGTGTIIDDDSGTPTPSLSIGNATVGEGGQAAFVVTLSSAPTADVTVVVNTTGGTATSGTDFTAITNQTLTFTPAGSLTQTVNVQTTADTLDEINETFTVTLSDVNANATIGTATGAGTITDDDAAPTIKVNSASGTEGSSIAFTVTLSAASGQVVTVVATTTPDTASNGDFTPTTQTLTFQPGTVTQTVNVITLDDVIVEPSENFTLTLSSPSNTSFAVPADAIGTGTINDNDSTGPTLSIDDVAATEGNSLTFHVTLSAAQTSPVVVVVTPGGGNATLNTDYTVATQTLTFAIGETSKNVVVTTTDDSLDEPNETFNLTLSGNSAGVNISKSVGVGTIQDNDATPSLSIANASATEGNNVSFTVTLSAASGQQVTVVATPSGGTATAGSDYTATAQTLTFAPGATTQTFNVATTDDSLIESPETFDVTLSAPTNATLGTASAVGTINDNDGVPTLSIGNSTVVEGGSASFIVSLAGVAATGPVTVVVTTHGGTATEGTDYTANNQTLTFAVGETSKTFVVATTGDTLDENDETFTVTLTNASAGTNISGANGTGTITDDDAAPTITITGPANPVNEGDTGTTDMNFTVTLSAASGKQITVVYNTANGTSSDATQNATAPSDYTAATGTLTFAPGDPLTKTITVKIKGDTFDESNESLQVVLTSPTNATLATSTATGIIADESTDHDAEVSKFSGHVYIDSDGDGVVDTGEKSLSGVTVNITGTLSTGVAYSSSATTDSTGLYEFPSLTPGSYTVTEVQPGFYLDGVETAGSSGVTKSTTVNDTFTFNISGNQTLTDNNFGERGLRPEFISKRSELASSITSNSSTNSLNLAAHSSLYSLDSGIDGTLTAQASASNGTANLTLYDNSMRQLVSSNSGRIDWNGTPGAPYFLSVSGSSTNTDVKLTNLVSQQGSTVIVKGTDGDDNFEFVGGTPNTFTINGVRYELNPANVTSLRFDGGGGNDTVTLTGSAANDIAIATLGGGSLSSAKYNVTVQNVENLSINGGGGNDTATLTDSALKDNLSASGHQVVATNSAGQSTSLANFATVTAKSTNGGADTKSIGAIDFVLGREGLWA